MSWQRMRWANQPISCLKVSQIQFHSSARLIHWNDHCIVQERERELTDNLRLRRHLKDIEKKKESIAQLESELGGIDAKHLERERRRLVAEQQELLKEVKTADGLKIDIIFVCYTNLPMLKNRKHAKWYFVWIIVTGAFIATVGLNLFPPSYI